MIQWIKDWLRGYPTFGRSSQWWLARKSHLHKEPVCQLCGTSKNLEVHHILPYHLYPEDELEEWNLITLCRHDHFVWGHLGHWKDFNTEVEKDCEYYKARLEK